jgi:hypothetical protein
MRSSIGSCPIGVITILPPAANAPTSSIRSMSAFHSGYPATSAHSRQMSSGATLVSTLCSVAHIGHLLSLRERSFGHPHRAIDHRKHSGGGVDTRF